MKKLKSHELAKILLNNPDLPIATHACNHTCLSDCRITVGILESYLGNHIIIGNAWKKSLNPPNWYITEFIEEML